MEVIKDDYIRKIEAVKILQKAYAEGRIKAKDGCVSVLDDINALPKADVQPVRRGKWQGTNEMPYDDIMVCSECKHEAYWDADYGQQLFNYCPNCGVRMMKDGDTNG